MKTAKVIGVDAVVVASTSSSSSSTNHPLSRCFSKPSWLLLTIVELEKRMKMMALNIPEDEDSADTFAERAENYYRKRPQLLNLLQDLYNGYLSLADRYCQSLAKNRGLWPSSPSLIPAAPCSDDEHEEERNVGEDIDSDVESSLSYQTPFTVPFQSKLDTDIMVAELVIKAVDYEILVDELSMVDRRWNESLRKIELQKSLLEVLESERLILLNENARLGYKVNTLIEENKGLASESLFMKRKASELARCVLKIREDDRVLMLSRKIEDLQEQIYGLEKRNKQYCEQLVKQEGGGGGKFTNANTKYIKNGGNEVTSEDCFQVEGVKGAGVDSTKTKTILGNLVKGGDGSRRKVSKWWDKAKNFQLFHCVPDFNSTCS